MLLVLVLLQAVLLLTVAWSAASCCSNAIADGAVAAADVALSQVESAGELTPMY